MDRPHMRPRIELSVGMSPEAVLARLRERLSGPDCPCRGAVANRAIEISMCDVHRHLWSPVLSVEVQDGPEGATLRGRFGPSPNVWSLFVALYTTTAILGVAGLMYGLSQVTLGVSPWALWGVPVAAGVGAALYAASFIGQGLGAEQMFVLLDHLERAVRDDDANMA